MEDNKKRPSRTSVALGCFFTFGLRCLSPPYKHKKVTKRYPEVSRVRGKTRAHREEKREDKRVVSAKLF